MIWAIRSFLAVVFLAASCLQAQTGPKQAAVLSVCSYDMESLILVWEDQLRKGEPQFKLDLRPNSATEVAKALIEGRSQLAPINREFKPEEIAAFKTRWGYLPTRIAVGVDALVVLVQKNNPLKELRIDQLDAIWTTTRLNGYPKDIATWGDLGLVGSNWAARPIVVIDRPDGDGLRDYFRQNITKGGTNKDTNRQCSDAMTLIEDLVSNQAAISYGGLGEVFNNLRTVPLVPPGGKNAVEASFETVASGEYPMTRVVYLYFNRAPDKPIDPTVLKFLQFVISSKGQKQLAPFGYVPLPLDMLVLNKKRLEH
ncbi:MAG: substrate-binding domain-containing protein [Geothrix sp.]|nr:substrate-binding domain-containing protein [Geothrix sp.]